jgi:CxxC motif-containing protein (DUF1111 family)
MYWVRTARRHSGPCLAGIFFLTMSCFAQSDPGPRGGAPAAGGPLPGLSASASLTAAFNHGSDQFTETEDVPNNGLGPRFNGDACSLCHSQPAVGGTSPANNPLFKFANAQNTVPSFITAQGPIREARFIYKPDGTADGGVHDLFTISGRSDAPAGCNLTQPNFPAQLSQGNVIFRIPTPVFGLGLIEAIPDSVLVQNVNQSANPNLGIQGHFNRSGNDGTITRFGWKAQNKSLLMFSGEAYNVEMGITNLLFNTEREEAANCSPVPPPNNIFTLPGINEAVFDDINNFSNFMRFLAPAARGPIDSTVTRGSQVFVDIGCANCHTPTLTTGASQFPALANQTIHPYSDFALHFMGSELADSVTQGLAAGDQFRTAPLWGIGQRLFFLHDGRTSDLLQAIIDHFSYGNFQYQASAANAVIINFVNLSASDQQAILNFLRSL